MKPVIGARPVLRFPGKAPLLLLLMVAGCVLTPQLGPAPSVGPAPPPLTQAQVDSVRIERMAADSAAAELNELIRQRYPGGVIPTRTLESADRTAASSSSRNPGARTTVPPLGAAADSLASSDTTGAQPPAISVDLPPQELSRLVGAARANLSWADSVAQNAALHPLPARERDKLEMALGLVKQGQDALQRGDIRGAANLGYKARLLVEEVLPR